MHHHKRSESVPAFRSTISFITQCTSHGINNEISEPKHKVLFYEAAKVQEIMKKENIASAANELDLTKENSAELSKMEETKLELYMRSRWATVLFTLKEMRNKNLHTTSKAVFHALFMKKLKEKIEEKIVFETTNPSLAKIMRSKTPPADAPRKIREEYRKAHPEEEDHFPDIVLQLDRDGKGDKKSVPVKEKVANPLESVPAMHPKKEVPEEEKKTVRPSTKRGASFVSSVDKKAMMKFPYRSMKDNPK